MRHLRWLGDPKTRLQNLRHADVVDSGQWAVLLGSIGVHDNPTGFHKTAPVCGTRRTRGEARHMQHMLAAAVGLLSRTGRGLPSCLPASSNIR